MFSRIIPLEVKDPQRHPLWVMAQRFGATCTSAATQADWIGVTHLITNTQHTLKVRHRFSPQANLQVQCVSTQGTVNCYLILQGLCGVICAGPVG
jgi:hypothetical protein